jgi:hypothetical protein
MHVSLKLVIPGLLAGLAALTLIVLGSRPMSDPSRMSFCHIESEADFRESVASYDRRPLQQPALPVRRLEFTLTYPFDVERDDILLVSAYSEGRGIEHRFYDGPPPAGPIIARLPAQAENSAEVYWLSVELIRVRDRMTCGWTMEERFELAAPAHPANWRIDLLDAPVSTDDGGARLTRITAQQ